MTQTLTDVLREHGRRHPDKVALVDHRRSLTYGEFAERGDVVAAALRHAGVTSGERVAYFDANELEFFELLAGCSASGAILVPLNTRLSVNELASVLRSSRPALVVAQSAYREIALAALADADLGTVQIVEIDGAGADSWPEWLAAGESSRGLPGTPADVLSITYTSGTTGTAKGAMIRHTAVTENIADALSAWEIDADSVLIAMLPLYHIGSLAWSAVGFMAGAKVVVLRSAAAADVMTAFEEHRGTHTNTVPTIFQTLIAEQVSHPRDISSIVRLTVGGSPVPAQLLRDAIEIFDCSVSGMYGLSEAGGGVATHHLGREYLAADPHGRMRSAGKPLSPDIAIEIWDLQTQRPLPQGEVGEIVFRSAATMAGYWNEPELTREVLTADGWLRTGDVGRIDEDGFLFIHDRLKDVIITGGENVYAAEVEDVLMSHPAVIRACVVGAPHPTWVETPVAFVIASAEVDPADLITWSRDRLAHFKAPTAVYLVDDLPLTSTGKLDKKAVRLDPRVAGVGA